MLLTDDMGWSWTDNDHLKGGLVFLVSSWSSVMNVIRSRYSD